MILKNGTVLNDNFIFEKKDLFIENRRKYHGEDKA